MTGFNSKRKAAADKVQEPEREALKLAEIIEHFDSNDESLPLELLKEIAATLRALAQPALPVQRQPLTDEQANKLVWIGAVSAPNGAIYREPLSYRKELMAHRLQGLRLGEAAHNIGAKP